MGARCVVGLTINRPQNKGPVRHTGIISARSMTAVPAFVNGKVGTRSVWLNKMGGWGRAVGEPPESTVCGVAFAPPQPPLNRN